jgi:hypothetical protein
MSEFEEPKFTGSLVQGEPQYVLTLGLMGSFLVHALALGAIRVAVVRFAGGGAQAEGPAPVEFVEVGADGEILPPGKVAVVAVPKPAPSAPGPEAPGDVAIAAVPKPSPTPSSSPSPTPSVRPSPTPSPVMQPKPKPVVQTPARSVTPKSPVRESRTPVQGSPRKEQNPPTEQAPPKTSPTTPIEQPQEQEAPVPVAKSDKKLSEGGGETVSSRGVIVSKEHVPTGFRPGEVRSAILGITMSDDPVLVQSSSKLARGDKFQVAVALSVICRQDGDRPICLVQPESIRLMSGQTVSPVQVEFAKAILTSDRITYKPSIQTSLQAPVLSSDWIVTVEVAII